MIGISNLIHRFKNDRRGVSAVEFALIAPVMIVMYFACIEVSFLMLVDRKVTNAASALGDLVARTASIDNTEMANIMSSAQAIFAPYSTNSAMLRVTSIEDDDGTAKVVWSDSLNMDALSPGTTMTVPDGLLPEDGAIIYAEVTFDYKSTLGYFLPSIQVIRDEFYSRPRRTVAVKRTNS